MRLRRSHAVAFVCVALATAFACGFPSVTFDAIVPDAGSLTDSGPDSAADGGADADAGARTLPPDVDPDGSTKDATSVGDAANPIDAAGCVTCDCDLDTFNRYDPPGCDASTPIEKRDCDDLIPAIHPESPFVTDPWPAASKHPIRGDWDCDGVTTKQLAYGVGECSTLVLGCVKEGFVDNPGCGEVADYVTCAVEGLIPTCTAHKVRKPQGCR